MGRFQSDPAFRHDIVISGETREDSILRAVSTNAGSDS